MIEFFTIMVAIMLVLWRLDRVTTAFIGLLQKNLELKETQFLRPIQQQEPMPLDLYQYAHQEDAEWAREQSLKHLRELRDELGSWNNVRSALSNGKMTDDVAE